MKASLKLPCHKQVGYYMRSDNLCLLMYNLQLPFKCDHWGFSSSSFGEVFGNYIQREIRQTGQTEQTGQTDQRDKDLTHLLLYHVLYYKLQNANMLLLEQLQNKYDVLEMFHIGHVGQIVTICCTGLTGFSLENVPWGTSIQHMSCE